ncbi:MAG: hypothetical protein ACPGVO_04415 [Spirulinaceae cyanobacterium]
MGFYTPTIPNTGRFQDFGTVHSSGGFSTTMPGPRNQPRAWQGNDLGTGPGSRPFNFNAGANTQTGSRQGTFDFANAGRDRGVIDRAYDPFANSDPLPGQWGKPNSTGNPYWGQDFNPRKLPLETYADSWQKSAGRPWWQRVAAGAGATGFGVGQFGKIWEGIGQVAGNVLEGFRPNNLWNNAAADAVEALPQGTLATQDWLETCQLLENCLELPKNIPFGDDGRPNANFPFPKPGEIDLPPINGVEPFLPSGIPNPEYPWDEYDLPDDGDAPFNSDGSPDYNWPGWADSPAKAVSLYEVRGRGQNRILENGIPTGEYWDWEGRIDYVLSFGAASGGHSSTRRGIITSLPSDHLPDREERLGVAHELFVWVRDYFGAIEPRVLPGTAIHEAYIEIGSWQEVTEINLIDWWCENAIGHRLPCPTAEDWEPPPLPAPEPEPEDPVTHPPFSFPPLPRLPRLPRAPQIAPAGSPGLAPFLLPGIRVPPVVEPVKDPVVEPPAFPPVLPVRPPERVKPAEGVEPFDKFEIDPGMEPPKEFESSQDFPIFKVPSFKINLTPHRCNRGAKAAPSQPVNETEEPEDEPLKFRQITVEVIEKASAPPGYVVKPKNIDVMHNSSGSNESELRAHYEELKEIRIEQYTQGGLMSTLLGIATTTKAGVLAIISNQKVQTILNFVNTVSSLHNAMMLSRDLYETITGTFELALRIFGFFPMVGHGNVERVIQLEEYISAQIRDIFMQIIGEQRVAEFTVKFKAFNRIYHAMGGVVDATVDMFSSTWRAAELTIGNIGKLGNALRRSGAVFEDSYDTMEETFYGNRQQTLNRLVNVIDNTSERIESVEDSVQSVYSAKQTMIEVGEELNELEEQVETARSKKDEQVQQYKSQAEEEINEVLGDGGLGIGRIQ